MGAVSPVPFADDAFVQKIKDQVIAPTMLGLQLDGIPYVGFVFIGLIKVGDDPKVIEYNVRMGDPETQVVLPRIQNDLFELLQATASGSLESIKMSIDKSYVSTIVAVSGGYPENFEKGKVIRGIDSDDFVVHAGTVMVDKELVTSGGRVLSATGFGLDHKKAIAKSYQTLAKIDFQGIYYRKDIGFDL